MSALDAAGRRPADAARRALHRLGRVQLRHRTAARAAQGGAGALRSQRHPRRHERPAGARPLRRGRPRGAVEGQALGDRAHQRFSPHDIERIVRMGLVLTTHTNNYLYKGLHVHAQALPPERHGEIVPLRSLLDAGVKVSLATDNVPITQFPADLRRRSRARAMQTKERVAPEQALTRMRGVALRHRRRRLSDVRRRQTRARSSPASLPTWPCSAPIR